MTTTHDSSSFAAAFGGEPADLRRRALLRGAAATALFSSTALLAACGGDGDAPAEEPGTPGPVEPEVPAVEAPTLVGRAILPTDSYVAGPTSGQFISGGDYDRAIDTYGYALPFDGKQPMQGFSAVIPGPVEGTFYAMQDNGFGGRAASPDALLHIYAIKPDWENGVILPVDFQTGEPLESFSEASYIRLSDPGRLLGYARVADGANYPGVSVSPPGQTIGVDPLITSRRLLTGYDIDPESVQRDAEGNFWIGDEFGPFLLKFNAKGELLAREVPLPNLTGRGGNPLIQSPNNPYLAGDASNANLPGSGGIESMAIDASRKRLYTLFEAAVNGDDPRRRAMSVYDLDAGEFLPEQYSYRVSVGQRINGDNNLETEIYTVNDMVAINDREFLVLEKDSGAGDVRTGLFAPAGTWRNAARFKRVFKVNLDRVDNNGDLVKEEVVDLMNLLDPDGVGGTATIEGIYAHPMESMEVVTIVDARTLLVVNDNNYPGGSPSRHQPAGRQRVHPHPPAAGIGRGVTG